MKSAIQRAGFTLIEILLGLLVGAVVGAAALSLLLQHQRLALALEQMMTARRATREGADVLRYDLRPIAPASGEIYDMGDTFVDFRLSMGFSILCGFDSTRNLMTVPARVTSSSLTSWIVAPEGGDTVIIYAAAGLPDSARWHSRVLASPPSAGPACPAGLAPDGSPALVPALGIRLTAPLPAAITVGAAMRFVRRARYELYRGTGGGWYLGFRDCLATRAVFCANVQPVSGPYPARGIHFRFLDSTGAPTANPHLVARIDVALRAETATPLHASGLHRGVFADTTLLTITPRN